MAKPKTFTYGDYEFRAAATDEHETPKEAAQAHIEKMHEDGVMIPGTKNLICSTPFDSKKLKEVKE